MVERIMLFKLHDESTRAEVAALTSVALGELPELEALSVGTPADASSARSWDLSVVLGFANLALLGNAMSHEVYRRYVDETMHPRCAVIKAWSFERTA